MSFLIKTAIATQCLTAGEKTMDASHYYIADVNSQRFVMRISTHKKPLYYLKLIDIGLRIGFYERCIYESVYFCKYRYLFLISILYTRGTVFCILHTIQKKLTNWICVISTQQHRYCLLTFSMRNCTLYQFYL